MINLERKAQLIDLLNETFAKTGFNALRLENAPELFAIFEDSDYDILVSLRNDGVRVRTYQNCRCVDKLAFIKE
ncbi:hypothetical protein SAMN04487821_1592 [Enterococcus malodoratus]|uniref:hypothetical protein n=1 Tax=Enterococcus malodoratus TaxID=71451 RepID=UPI0008AD73EC|nr:hypothetical protein [Enterococcus malodoratus]SEU03068.1 hypothetical protein SAMN04487821_1592 [Enterococcus malodoratus]